MAPFVGFVDRSHGEPVRERDIEKHLVECVQAMGGEVRKVKWIGRRGAPDRVVMIKTRRFMRDGILHIEPAKPRTIWVELKAPGKEPEPHQAREHKRMRAMGQHVEVVDSFDRVYEVLA